MAYSRQLLLGALVAVGSLLIGRQSEAGCELPPPVVLALEKGGTLRAQEHLVKGYQADLARIADAFPYLGSLCATFLWVPGEIIVALTDEAFAEWERGEFHGFDPILLQIGFQGAEIYSRSSRRLRLLHDKDLHSGVAANLFRGVPGVRTAYPNPRETTWGCDPSDIWLSTPDTYRFLDAYKARPCGWRTWTVKVTPTGPVLVSGAPFPVGVERRSWGTVKSQF